MAILFDLPSIWKSSITLLSFVFDVLIDYSSFEIRFAQGNEGEISDFLRKISPLVVSMSREPAAVRIAIFSAASSATMSGLNIFHMKIQVGTYSKRRLKRIFFFSRTSRTHLWTCIAPRSAIRCNIHKCSLFFRFTCYIATGNSIKGLT